MNYSKHNRPGHTPPYRGDSDHNKINTVLVAPTCFPLQKLLSTLFLIIACRACLLCTIGFNCYSNKSKTEAVPPSSQASSLPADDSNQSIQTATSETDKTPDQKNNQILKRQSSIDSGIESDMETKSPPHAQNNQPLHLRDRNQSIATATTAAQNAPDEKNNHILIRQSSIDSGIESDMETEKTSHSKNDLPLDSSDAPATDSPIPANASPEPSEERSSAQPKKAATDTTPAYSDEERLGYMNKYINIQKEIIKIIKRTTDCLADNPLEKTIMNLVEGNLEKPITPLSTQAINARLTPVFSVIEELELALNNTSNGKVATEGYEALYSKASTEQIAQATTVIEQLEKNIYNQYQHLLKYPLLGLLLDPFSEQVSVLIKSLEYIESMLQLEPTGSDLEALWIENAIPLNEMRSNQLHSVRKVKASNLKERLRKVNQPLLEEIEEIAEIEKIADKLKGLISNNYLTTRIKPIEVNLASLSRLTQKAANIRDLANRLEEIQPRRDKIIKEIKGIIQDREKIMKEVAGIKEAEEAIVEEAEKMVSVQRSGF